MNSVLALSVPLVLFSFICSNYGQKKHRAKEKSPSPKRTPEDILVQPHYVTTMDGYILELQRVQWKRRTQELCKPVHEKTPVALLMHGMFGSAKGFTHLGMESSIAYNLAETGIDVWMGNARGTTPSRHHIILNPKNPVDWTKYFNYGFDEISKYDVSAMIDYILKYTSSAKLHYVGHSHGGYYLFMLSTVQPEYANKISSVHLLGCAGSLKNLNIINTQSIKYLKNLYQWGLKQKIMELRPADLNHTAKRQICKKDLVRCENELTYLVELMASPTLRTEPVSTKQLTHYGQILDFQEFKSWDQGSSGNLMIYGSLDPISYNFSAITAPTTIYFSNSDILTTSGDVNDSK